MSDLSLVRAKISPSAFETSAPFVITLDFTVNAEIAFDLNVAIDIVDATNGTVFSRNYLSAGGWDVSWLPRGTYQVHAMLPPNVGFPQGSYSANIALLHHDNGAAIKAGEATLRFDVYKTSTNAPQQFSWHIQSQEGTKPIEDLSWRRGNVDWFSKHFDHEVRTTTAYLLKNSPLLKGKVLNVGCGDGTTDFGIALRIKPQEMVGIDPFLGYERLPEVLEKAEFPITQFPENLRFLPASANEIPFPDDYFDVVLSWGSLEHIVGGYFQALKEIRRVLKPGGLLMVHPGLFYSDIGNHLGEFRFAREEPYVHLKYSREWLREKVLSSEPDRIDRCGDDANSAQYWQWFTELNPITVPQFEKELREHDFEPWRVILRTHDHVDYTPELQKYSFVDLLAGELYVSAYNRKKAV